MLTIRNEQLRMFEEQARTRAILAHTARFFPEVFTGDRRDAEARIARAIQRATAHGFVSYRDLQQFVDLVLQLGEDFESRPELQWTREILNDRHPARAPFRATTLYDRVVGHLAKQETRNVDE